MSNPMKIRTFERLRTVEAYIQARRRRVWVRQIFNATDSMTEAARVAGMQIAQMRKMCKSLGIDTTQQAAKQKPRANRNGRGPEFDAKVMALYEQRVSLSMAARRLKLTPQGVKYHEKRLGICFARPVSATPSAPEPQKVEQTPQTPLERMKALAAIENSRMRKASRGLVA